MTGSATAGSPGNGHPLSPGLAGLVAVAATLLALPGSLLLVIALISIWWTSPDLSQDSLLLLLVGMGTLSVVFFALAGFFAGLLEVFRPGPQKGLGSLALTVNAVILIGILALFLVGSLAR
ncbi:MAG: hypothetical protein KDA80_24055 [Planctomycetaceae bacterium]|nr:hypothetical protein [Planctomycetaceae bacterium]